MELVQHHAPEVNLVDDGHGLTMFQHDLARGQQLKTHTHTIAQSHRSNENLSTTSIQLLNCSIISSIVYRSIYFSSIQILLLSTLQCHVSIRSTTTTKTRQKSGGLKALQPRRPMAVAEYKGRRRWQPKTGRLAAVAALVPCVCVVCVSRNKSLSERSKSQCNSSKHK